MNSPDTVQLRNYRKLPNPAQTDNLRRLRKFVDDELRPHPHKLDMRLFVGEFFEEENEAYELEPEADGFKRMAEVSDIAECNTAGCLLGWAAHIWQDLDLPVCPEDELPMSNFNYVGVNLFGEGHASGGYGEYLFEYSQSSDVDDCIARLDNVIAQAEAAHNDL